MIDIKNLRIQAQLAQLFWEALARRTRLSDCVQVDPAGTGHQWRDWGVLSPYAKSVLGECAQALIDDCKGGMEQSFRFMTRSLLDTGKQMQEEMRAISQLADPALAMAGPEAMEQAIQRIREISTMSARRMGSVEVPAEAFR